jgi:hypothetical protein
VGQRLGGENGAAVGADTRLDTMRLESVRPTQPCWKHSLAGSLRRRKDAPLPGGGALKQRIIFTVRRTVRVVVASAAVELALDLGAGALAAILAPFVGTWVYVAAAVIVIGSLPLLGLNIARVARREWRRHAHHA